MAVAKAAREFIIRFKNIENYFNSLIIIMKTRGEDGCVGGEGRLVGQQERRKQAGKGIYKPQFPKESVCTEDSPRPKGQGDRSCSFPP